MQRQITFSHGPLQLAPRSGCGELLATSYTEDYTPAIPNYTAGNPVFTVYVYEQELIFVGDKECFKKKMVLAIAEVTAASVCKLNGKDYFISGRLNGLISLYNLTDGDHGNTSIYRTMPSTQMRGICLNASKQIAWDDKAMVTSIAPFYDEKHFFVAYGNGLIGFFQHHDHKVSYVGVLNPSQYQPQYRGLPVYIMFVDLALHYLIHRSDEHLCAPIKRGGTYEQDVSCHTDILNICKRNYPVDEEDGVVAFNDQWINWVEILFGALIAVRLPDPNIYRFIEEYARDPNIKIFIPNHPGLFKPWRTSLTNLLDATKEEEQRTQQYHGR